MTIAVVISRLSTRLHIRAHIQTISCGLEMSRENAPYRPLDKDEFGYRLSSHFRLSGSAAFSLSRNVGQAAAGSTNRWPSRLYLLYDVLAIAVPLALVALYMCVSFCRDDFDFETSACVRVCACEWVARKNDSHMQFFFKYNKFNMF